MRLIRISFLLFVSSWWLAAAQDFAALAQRAVQLQQSGDYAGAESAYRELLQLDPNQVATRVNLGIVLVNLHKYDEAIAQYRAAEQLLPGDSRVQTNLALAYEKGGHLPEACQEFAGAHVAAPNDDRITLLLADCQGQLGRNADVVELLQPLAGTHAEEAAFDYMLGMALLRQQRIAEGQVYLDRILRHGDTAEAHYLLGTRMYESGDYPSAIKEFGSAARLHPDLPQLHRFLALSLLNTGDPGSAEAEFRAALKQEPQDAESNLGLTQILAVRKRYPEALLYARRAAELRPDDPAATLALAQVLGGLRQWPEAERVAQRAVSQNADAPEAHRVLAEASAALGHPAQAASERRIASRLTAVQRDNEEGPKPGQPAPQFTLSDAEGAGSFTLASYRGKSPLVLVFGSYTCPNFRDAAASLTRMQAQYGSAIPFRLIYIREAHSAADWQSSRNADGTTTLAPASGMQEKQAHAQLCSRKLHLPFPASVDGMDNAVETAYAAWPSRVFVIDAQGRIAYRTRLTELDFHPAEMEEVLAQLSQAAISRNKTLAGRR